MAGDTREDQSPQNLPSNSSNKRPYQGKIYETFNVPATPENANSLPGGTANTAGGKERDYGLVDAAKTVKLEELKSVHMKPCVRDSLLVGIGGGFGIGGVRAILGTPIWKTCNWAVGSFCFGSFLMYQFCQQKRYLEKQGMSRAVEIIDRKKLEKEKHAEEIRAARRKAKEEATAKAEEEEARKKRNWWKPW